MTDAPSALAFFDPVHRVHGVWRAGLTLLYEDDRPSALSAVPQVSTMGADEYRAVLDGRFELDFVPVAEEARLRGSRVRLCRVRGTVGESRLECLGTVTHVDRPPEWAELDALRSVSAIFDEGHAVLAEARRPREAPGHGREAVTAALVTDGAVTEVEEARISTVYDAGSRQRTAGLELWMPGEGFPRRASGSVSAGTTLALEGLVVNAAVFRWAMDGREGAGAYDITVRDEPVAA